MSVDVFNCGRTCLHRYWRYAGLIARFHLLVSCEIEDVGGFLKNVCTLNGEEKQDHLNSKTFKCINSNQFYKDHLLLAGRLVLWNYVSYQMNNYFSRLLSSFYYPFI